MGNFTRKSNCFLSILPLAALVFISACSDDNKEATANKASVETSVASAKEVSTEKAKIASTIVGNNKGMTANKLEDKSNYDQMSKPLDKASWVEKGRFKKEFTKDCIGRELKTAGTDKLDRAYIEKTCACIADYMDENLTDQEAEEYLGEDNHMRALQIRYDTAAYQCIQGAKNVEEPKVTRFR